jgi:hypothetical protein
MPRIEDVDNADNVNREKNRCRDTQKISYRYRHKEYDVDRSLHEVLDNNNRVLPGITSREPDGTKVGNLIAELTRRGLGNSNTHKNPGLENFLKDDIPDSYNGKQGLISRRNNNPNKKVNTKKSTFDHELPNGEDEDGSPAEPTKTL